MQDKNTLHKNIGRIDYLYSKEEKLKFWLKNQNFLSQFFDTMSLNNVCFHMTNIWYKGISADRCCSSPTALIRNTENWKINVRYTEWVPKYSSDLVGLEKYHKIPFSTTGFVKTGLYPQFLPQVELKLWRHTQDLFLRSFLYFSWHYSLPS